MVVRAPGLTVEASEKRGPPPRSSPSQIEIIDTQLVEVVGTPYPRRVLESRKCNSHVLLCIRISCICPISPGAGACSEVHDPPVDGQGREEERTATLVNKIPQHTARRSVVQHDGNQTGCAPPFRCGMPSSTAASRLSRPSSWQTGRSMFDAGADRSLFEHALILSWI